MIHNLHFETSLQPFYVALEEQNKNLIPSLTALKNVYGKPVHLASAMEVYKIYRAIMRITLVVAEKLQHLKNDWETILLKLNGYTCTVKDSSPISIDTSVAYNILNKKIRRIDFAILKLEDYESRLNLIKFIMEMDLCTFREKHSVDFLDAMLKPKEARAFVAHQTGEHIVGCLWGFSTQYENRKIFHIWLLVIRPDFSNLGVGNQLLQFFMKEIKDYHDVSLVTLNVDHHNDHARVLYVKEGFKVISVQTEKTCMGCSLTNEQTVQLSPETAKNIVQDYVLKKASFFDLALWEASRQFELTKSKLYWSFENPKYETITLSLEKQTSLSESPLEI